jgi:hypothetical protein
MGESSGVMVLGGPAEFMVERFVEILKSMASSDSRLCGVAAAS